jgi:MinD superfamily P-loop ATPase
MAQNVIFSVEGGLGKSIMATAVLKVIKKEYKKT